MQDQGRPGDDATGAQRPPRKPEIPYETFAALDLRLARVVAAEKHPGADKLTVIRVDLGDLGERQLVAGVAQFYPPEALVGQMIVVVANLKPVRLRGVESQGMLLAATGEGKVVLLTTVGNAEPGWPVS